MKNSELKQKLDDHYKYFDKSQISPDPLEFLHRFSNPADIEISGFISSVFAYGNVKQIINTLNKIHSLIGNNSHQFVLNYSLKTGRKLFANLKHRFYSTEDIVQLFFALNKILKDYGSIKSYFIKCFNENDFDMKKSISAFSNGMIKFIGGGDISHGLKFMFPDPLKGSACKRMNLFLRWMVRKDELDFGLWTEIPKSKLIIPVDTHVARVCRQLKLTGRKNVSWKMAEEITNRLKLFDEKDPVKYDFAICHIGMRKLKF